MAIYFIIGSWGVCFLSHLIHCSIKWSKVPVDQDITETANAGGDEADQTHDDDQMSDSASFVTCFEERYETRKLYTYGRASLTFECFFIVSVFTATSVSFLILVEDVQAAVRAANGRSDAVYVQIDQS